MVPEIHTDPLPPQKPRSFRSTLGLLGILALMAATAWCTHLFEQSKVAKLRGTQPAIESGPWGDLLTYNIRVEQPTEYTAFQQLSTSGPRWHFGTLSLPAIRQLLLDSGLTETQVATAVAPQNILFENGNITLKGDEPLILSLSPEVRSKLYLELAKNPANQNYAMPCYVPNNDVTKILTKDRIPLHEITPLIRKLIYQRNGFSYFSDQDLVLTHIQTKEGRQDFFQSLTGQNAVIVRLLVRPTTDLDKVLNYWGLPVSGVRMKDLRPLLEAEQRLPDGGHLSILYFLPPLARERLYTSPLPSQNDQKPPDCHWSALNFFNSKPDDRLLDPAIASRVVVENYYKIAKPGIYGDLVLLLNQKGHVVHSAVYIADNIVFTKNGINFAVPWLLMRTNDMLGAYSHTEPLQLVYYRRNDL